TGQRRECIAAAMRARISDLEIIEQEVGAHPERVRSGVVRKVVHYFVELVDPSGGRTRERAEGDNTGDAYRRAGLVGRQSLQCTVRKLAARLVHCPRR